MKIIFATGKTVDLAEWIIDDTSLKFQYVHIYSFYLHLFCFIRSKFMRFMPTELYFTLEV